MKLVEITFDLISGFTLSAKVSPSPNGKRKVGQLLRVLCTGDSELVKIWEVLAHVWTLDKYPKAKSFLLLPRRPPCKVILKMLESRPADALVKLVKTVEIVETVDCGDYGDCRDRRD